MTALDDLAARLAAARDAVLARRRALEDGRPWPLAERFGTEPEASWGPPETLAHVAEMLPYWLGEAERILDGSGEPIAFGRVADDPLRIGMIERDRSLPIRELLARIDAGAGRILARLGELDDGAAARRGVHARLGEMTVAQLVDRFVVSHLEEHARQLSDVLAARDGSDAADTAR